MHGLANPKRLVCATFLICLLQPAWDLAQTATVATPDGCATIDSLQVGESVLGLMPGGDLAVGHVNARRKTTTRRCLRIFVDGHHEPLTISADRLVFTPGGWKQAGELRDTDWVVTDSGTARVLSISSRAGTASLDELSILPFENYFQNGVLIHNWSKPRFAEEHEVRGVWVGELPHHWTTMYRLELGADGRGLLAARNGTDPPHRHVYKVERWSVVKGEFRCTLTQIDSEGHEVPLAVKGIAHPGSLDLEIVELRESKQPLKLQMRTEAAFLAELQRQQNWDRELGKEIAQYRANGSSRDDKSTTKPANN